MELSKIELYKDGKLLEYKLRIFTAKVYAESLKILKELKQSEFEIKALELATEYEKSKDLNIAKQMVELQNENYDIDTELHNYLVYCKLLNYNLQNEQVFDEEFWLEQDKEKIEQFIIFFRKSKKLARN